MLLRLIYILLLLQISQLAQCKTKKTTEKPEVEEEETEEEDDDATEEPEPLFKDCNDNIVVREERNSTYILKSPFNKTTSELYPADSTCAWQLVGDPNCTVEILCEKGELVPSKHEKCSTDDEHLEISDGTGGYELFCNKIKFSEPIVASKNLRDLYVRYKGADKMGVKRSGFNCVVKCTSNPAGARSLKVTKERKIEESCVCGVKKTKPKRPKRVVSGYEAGLNEWPWQVAIVKPGTRTSFCGGAILNSRHILTAAHCTFFDQMKPEQVEILLHARQLDRTDRKFFRKRQPPLIEITKYQERLKKLLQQELAAGLKNITGGGNLTSVIKQPKLPKGQNFTVPTGNLSLPKQNASSQSLDAVLKPTKLPKLKPTLPPLGLPPFGQSRKRREEPKKNKQLDLGLGRGKNLTGDEELVRVKNLSDSEEHSLRFKVVKITNHPLFTTAYDFDVSVMELDRDIKMGIKSKDDHTSLCLPNLGYEEKFVGADAYVVGWGLKKQDDNITDGTLAQVKVVVMENKNCQNWTHYEVTSRMLCAGYEEGVKDACVGDSGGPLNSLNEQDQWMQIGIVSWGEGCAQPKKPGIYSRVTELNQWIHYQTLEHGKWCKNEKD